MFGSETVLGAVRFVGDGFLCQDFGNTDVQGPREKTIVYSVKGALNRFFVQGAQVKEFLKNRVRTRC